MYSQIPFIALFAIATLIKELFKSSTFYLTLSAGIVFGGALYDVPIELTIISLLFCQEIHYRVMPKF